MDLQEIYNIFQIEKKAFQSLPKEIQEKISSFKNEKNQSQIQYEKKMFEKYSNCLEDFN